MSKSSRFFKCDLVVTYLGEIDIKSMGSEVMDIVDSMPDYIIPVKKDADSYEVEGSQIVVFNLLFWVNKGILSDTEMQETARKYRRLIQTVVEKNLTDQDILYTLD